MRILVVGDVIEDIIVIPSGNIRRNTDTSATIHKTMGGAAANVASWLSILGCNVSFAACVGKMDKDKIQLNLSGVDCLLQTSDKPTGSLVSLVEGDNRSMLTDRGANQDLDLSIINTRGFGIVYLSGYALIGKTKEVVSNFIGEARAAGAIVAIDPGSYGFIEDYGVTEYRDLMVQADLAFPNAEEEQLLSLSGKLPLTVITRGRLGSVAVFSSGERIETGALETNLVDPTGAGDAYSAGFIKTLATELKGSWLDRDLITKALESGQAAGARAVSTMGARARP